MGFLNKMFGGNKNQPSAQTAPIQNTPTYHPQAAAPVSPASGGLQLHKGLNLTKAESEQNLVLRKQTFNLVLTKTELGIIKARIVFVMDKSGSARKMFNEGIVQKIIERLLPLALKLDDNGELDMYLFSSDGNAYKRLDSITEQDFYKYVEREILSKRENNFWGGTEYAPIINEIVRQYGIVDPSSVPTYVIFITDGANSDRTKTEQALTAAAQYPIFWEFIGINEDKDEFKFLQKLDDLKGRVIDNADFFQLNHIDDMEDEELYELLMTEFPSWIEEAKRKGILR